jgi:hypothetical protein
MALISPANPTTSPEIHGSIRFTDLPVEIKEKIYEYAMRMDGQFNIPIYAAQAKGASFDDGVYPQIHATCRTNKLERAIATLVMIRNSTVCLHRDTDVKSMTKWIKEATGDAEQGFSAVRKVKVKYVSRFRMIKTDADMKFLEACPNLHTVSLEFSHRKLSVVEPSNSLYNWPSLTSTAMLEKFKLLQIATCGKLRHVSVKIDTVFILRPFPDQCREMRKAIQVFRAAFAAKNGRELNVRLIRSNADSDSNCDVVIHWSMATQMTGDWITTKADWGDEDYEQDEDDGEEEEEAEESESESGDDDQVDYDEGAEDESDESDEEDEDESDDDDEEGENDGGEQEEA